MYTWKDTSRMIYVINAGIIMVFFAQPSFYQKLNLFSDASEFEEWRNQLYLTNSLIFFSASVAATIVWYLIACNAKINGPKDVKRFSLFWWGLMPSPIGGSKIALSGLSASDPKLLPYLIAFYILDIGIVYWLATALSTPGLLKYTVPGAFYIRRFFNIK